MKRVFITTFLSLIIASIWQSISINWFSVLNVFFLPAIVLVFCVYYYRPMESIFVALLSGLIVDVLGGFIIGSNMLLMLIFTFAMSAFNLFTGRIHRRDFIYYVMAISFLYRFVFLIGQLIASGSDSNIFIMHLFLGPIIDGLISIPFYHLLVKILALFKAFDQNEFFKNRIGYRP